MNELKPVEIVVYCARCNRKLKTDKSKKNGYGPSCERKAIVEGIQMRMSDFIDDN